ncbi:MAG: Structural maintenance of chromosomes protein 6 [Thelocarpon superellum]|nr:MAG: Structural maintenance of chromosomes protein 6 [Thelocarpon superellum]
MPAAEVGQSIPPDTAHAVSVSLPTWKANVGYEEGEEWVLSKMETGYPRFYIHKSIAHFADIIRQRYGKANEQAMLFPSHRVALRCAEFVRIQAQARQQPRVRAVELQLRPTTSTDTSASVLRSGCSAVLYPSELHPRAKSFWQHSGEGISSRRAEHCHRAYERGELMVPGDAETVEAKGDEKPGRGPRRYQRSSPPPKSGVDLPKTGDDPGHFVEERFGRNLSPSQSTCAKVAIRRRIAGAIHTAASRLDPHPSSGTLRKPTEDDIYLYPTGMASIFNAHRVLSMARGSMESVCFGFPYIDTLKILEKWGPGCLFYGNGSSEDLDELEQRLARGERYLALFCEFPSNPLLQCPDLRRIKALGQRYDMAVVIDETVGNFLNVHVFPYADVVVSSLTKVFSGDSNVMGGSTVLNPESPYYPLLKKTLATEYEDDYWGEDAIFMERNSRDYASRIQRINANAEAIGRTLRSHGQVKTVYYPKYNPTRSHYDACRTPDGGYGGLLSVTFSSTAAAVIFFDRLETAKGPSLGTNFTLSCPYTLLAHYGELDWVAQFGVERDLVRVSIGLEETLSLIATFERALAAISSSTATVQERPGFNADPPSSTPRTRLYAGIMTMAPLKRTRLPADDGDMEVIAVESARSHLRQDTRKRARVADARRSGKARMSVARSESGMSEVDGEDDDDHQAATLPDDDEEVEGRRRPNDDWDDATDEDENENEDLDTQRATQIIQRRNRMMTMENIPADNGIIESVTCINFMCHNKLQVTLGPLINFIIGHNGSGKSAVLTALTLCLGGKATSTNRGQSLRSFIKEGQETATLIVKIKNTGHSAYQPETYGDSIVVERHFSKAGASSFKLKSASGRNISTKKADLEEICDFFALQIDNPMNVLTQDMARQFLNNSTPADKYRFFVKGVQLEQLDQDYKLLEETIDQIEAKLQSRKDDVKAIGDRARKAHARMERSEKQNSVRERIRNYQRQMAWAQVEQQERVAEQMSQDLRDADQRILDAEGVAMTSEQTFAAAHDAAEQAKAGVQGVREGAISVQDERKQIKDQFDANRKELLEVQTQQRSIRDQLKGAEKSIDKAQRDIAEEHARLEATKGASHTRRLAEIEAARTQATEAKVAYDEHHASRSQLEIDIRLADEEHQASTRPIEHKRVEIGECDRRLSSLQRERGQQHSAFHENMPRLLSAIGNEPGFREPPVGPVGNHVRLRKPLWSSVLEKSFGGTLNSFIVTSKFDQGLLSSLMRRVGCVCPILIGNHHAIDTSRTEPDECYDTTLRVLEIDNDLVRRQLIINQSIEQTILIESREEANRAMYEGARLRNVKQCFCLHESRRGWGLRLGYGRTGEPSSSPMAPPEGKPRMKTDTESQIAYQRETQQVLRRELDELDAQAQRLAGQVQSRREAQTRHQRQSRELQEQVQRAEERVEKLHDDLERDSVEDGRLEALKVGLQEAQELKMVNENQYENAVTQKDQLNAVSATLKQQLNHFDTELRDWEAKVVKAEAKALRLSKARQAALQEKNVAFQSVIDARQDRHGAAEKDEAQQTLVREWTAQARRVVERVPVDAGETPASLDKKLVKLMGDVERYQRELGGTRDEIAAAAAETAAAHRTAREQVRNLDDLAQLLKSALSDRQDRWRKFQRFISARARAQFTYLLSERSFRGSLKTDHKLRLLDLHVEPDETKTGKGRQTKTLSGGEKSFSTICLLLSLWEAMGSPIRCLDEFDVFMDNVNRDVSLKMMIGAARRSPGRQFILITPQAMGNVDVAGDVRIIKLSDPERGQTSLAFA